MLNFSNNHTMAWGLNAAADVVSNASSVSGTFPATSNAMTFVSVTDPAIATLTSAVVTTGSSVNAGTTGYLAGSFTLVAANSAVLLDRIVITQNGSIISGTDVTNVKLVTTGGQQLGSVLPNLSADGKGTFVMSPAYEIPSGQTIQVNVYADVVGGVNRTLIFNVLNLRDLQARDKTYNVGVSPSATLALTTTTVEAGTLTLTLDPSSPTGNIAPSQTNVTVLKVKVVAYGEQVKVLYIPFQIVTGGGTTDFTGQVDNIYMVDDAGNQIGTTITAADSSVAAGGTWDNNDSTAATFGTSSSNINYLIPANTTRIWSLKLDVVSTASSTMTTSLVAGTNNYQGQISNVSTGDTTAVGGNQLTITSSPFQAKQNSAFGAGNIVKGQTAAKIGSFVLSASSAEGINVSTITLTSSSTFPFANLMIKVNGVQFGDNKGSLLAATDYTFAGTSPVLIPAGGSVTVDAYVDVLTSATALGSSTYVKLDSASAVGALTASSQTLKTTGGDNVDNSNDIAGQSFTVNTTGGTMTIAKDAASPASYQAVMGKTGQSLGIWRFTGSAVSDTNITDMTVTASTSVSCCCFRYRFRHCRRGNRLLLHLPLHQSACHSDEHRRFYGTSRQCGFVPFWRFHFKRAVHI
ncbi:MAG: LPXTG-motif cell wall anchor domain protein [Candidatus Azambacteria bacterium GW2011_GWA2_42_9]|uniref:LPXTG-motif cell wall anchor domain protein n=1 Tax=Candidatus Azambacteria bacterium GW2011_GWA2_42_9 TaxID=1618613 RepID=A0A0G1BRR2_9BACT|nr:MAG: LPXTG-motif cell wall anchor domain protein [Candidatus Azambacteria bacterium GW2011_GWA2_42_9]